MAGRGRVAGVLEVHGWTGYRYGPRLADHRLWVIDARADYGPLQGLARNRANTSLIAGQWDQICRLAASLEARTVTPSAILHSLQRGANPSSLGRALAELGRIVKTLHILDYCHDRRYRRALHRILGRGESRNSLDRDTFHGGRGQPRQHHQTGQENQLGALGLMVNVIVLWQTVYIAAALDHLAAGGHKIDPADVARLSPLRPPHNQPQRPLPHDEPGAQRRVATPPKGWVTKTAETSDIKEADMSEVAEELARHGQPGPEQAWQHLSAILWEHFSFGEHLLVGSLRPLPMQEA